MRVVLATGDCAATSWNPCGGMSAAVRTVHIGSWLASASASAAAQLLANDARNNAGACARRRNPLGRFFGATGIDTEQR